MMMNAGAYKIVSRPLRHWLKKGKHSSCKAYNAATMRTSSLIINQLAAKATATICKFSCPVFSLHPPKHVPWEILWKHFQGSWAQQQAVVISNVLKRLQLQIVQVIKTSSWERLHWGKQGITKLEIRSHQKLQLWLEAAIWRLQCQKRVKVCWKSHFLLPRWSSKWLRKQRLRTQSRNMAYQEVKTCTITKAEKMRTSERGADADKLSPDCWNKR